MDQIPDINEWLVTPQNPPRAIDGLDYERCAALHNYLIRYAWVASNRPLCDLKFQSWFDNHGNAANDLRSRLEPNLVKFLEAVYDPSGSDDTILFYWVSGLTYPDELWFDWEGYSEDGEESRRMTLYRTNSGLLGGHNDGLCYDQKLHKAAMFISIDDQDFANRLEHEHLWHPLETVLSNWISTIRIGKISAGPSGVKLHNEKYGPWMYHSYSPQQVEETVTAFNRLVIAIECRIPKSAKKWPTSNPLISQQILDSTSVPNPSFARSFLTMIRPPNFKYIAPGLLLPTPESFASSQPFTSVKQEDDRL
ncbi:uncharacterized protein PAC_17206 [Phialocephala subalpina]|uniref:Uncharacterized protein n=1 Tax=Phialocephala subalpina TaxID=576137 RepID=A0A1L7XQV0_9HELO|nr:uncharacterized protein PAC_17206 [Phialocephala subalpina]